MLDLIVSSQNYLILSSQNELVDNVTIYESSGSSDNNQIHFNTKVKTGNTYKKTMEEEFQQRQIKRDENISSKYRLE